MRPCLPGSSQPELMPEHKYLRLEEKTSKGFCSMLGWQCQNREINDDDKLPFLIRALEYP